jgi:hypothetical protein
MQNYVEPPDGPNEQKPEGHRLRAHEAARLRVGVPSGDETAVALALEQHGWPVRYIEANEVVTHIRDTRLILWETEEEVQNDLRAVGGCEVDLYWTSFDGSSHYSRELGPELEKESPMDDFDHETPAEPEEQDETQSLTDHDAVQLRVEPFHGSADLTAVANALRANGWPVRSVDSSGVVTHIWGTDLIDWSTVREVFAGLRKAAKAEVDLYWSWYDRMD